jgi:GntR family transcriptional regulator/MocR family aminotransferase
LQSIARHYLRPPRRSGLLLGYAGLSVRELEAAMEVFGQCVRELAPH